MCKFLLKSFFQFLLIIFCIQNNAFSEQFSVCNIPNTGIPEKNLDRSISFEADNINLSIGSKPTTNLIGNVTINNNDSTTTSNEAIYDPTNESLILNGEVRFADKNVNVTSQTAEFSYSTGTISFEQAAFDLNENSSQGNAESIKIQEQGILTLNNVSYTTCPIESNGWIINAQDILLDPNKGKASARKVGLKFKGIPILYIPKISFPIDNSRKSGFLAPEIGGGGRSGNEFRLPFYFNIAKNYDATITPRLLTGRGFQLGSEFRYINQNNNTKLKFDYLENDNIYGKSRHYIQFNHKTNFNNGLRALIDFGDTSDGHYFEDLGGNLSLTSITHLNQSLLFDAYGKNWSFIGRFQNFQTIDENISQGERPYYRLPQIKFATSLPYKPFGISASLDSEIVYFDREFGVTGWRIDVEPQIDWTIKNDGWYINPSFSWKHTQYELKNFSKDQSANPSRSIPITSIDAGLFFERKLGNLQNHIQTFEPRILYLKTPYREQSNLPIFDTIEPDLNIVQLFQKNRFLGIDRIADTEQISLGFSSKIANNKTGREVISGTLGKAFYLQKQTVSLPGQELYQDSSSDLIAELRFLVFDKLNLDFSHQWNNKREGVARSQARLQYKPSSNKLLNVGYRFRQDLLEQGNISWSWPLTESWNFLGHYNYSLRDKRTLEQFYGLEYESCCWGIRMIYRQYVSTRDGQEDNSFGIQFVLKGMTSIGTKANKLLERGILGYSDYIQ